MGTLCCGRRQEATTAAAAVPAARIDWPPAAAGWPAPRLRDALKNQRNIKLYRENERRLRRKSLDPRSATYYLCTLYILYTRARARAHRTLHARIRTSARDGRHERLHTLHHSRSVSWHTRVSNGITPIYIAILL